MITYRILSAEGRYTVYREGLVKGDHGLEARAVQAAKFMAAVEASRFGQRTEVLLHLPGRIDLIAQFAPDEPIRPPLPAITVGDEVVVLR